MARIHVRVKTLDLLRRFTKYEFAGKDVYQVPDGSIEIELPGDTMECLRQHAFPSEEPDDTLLRILLTADALRTN